MKLILLFNMLVLIFFPGTGIGLTLGCFVYILGIGVHVINTYAHQNRIIDEVVLTLTTFVIIVNLALGINGLDMV